MNALTTETQKDYRITLKVRNANLLRAIEDLNETPGAIFAEKAGISYTTLNNLIGCKVSPIKDDGEYREGVMNLCEHLNKMPCELFSEKQLEPLEINTADVELTHKQCAALSKGGEPEGMLGEDHAIYKALDRLTLRQALVIKRRFGLEGPEETLKEVGELLGVSSARVRDIEAQALRKLRHPNSTKIITGDD